MRRIFACLLGIILAGCAALPTSSNQPDVAGLPSEVVPSLTATFISASPSVSPTIIASITPTPTIEPTATATATGTATETPVVYAHVFPVQPSNAAGFAEGTSSHGYPATDIFAPVGTKFVAVTEGIVNFVSYEDQWNPDDDDPALRGGLSVAIIGEDGLRYYGSHLSEIAGGIAPGVRVAAGQLLGLVGNSGNARTTLSHVHFGISPPTFPEDWKTRRGTLDPFPFLQAWRDGVNVTPPLIEIPADQPAATPTGTPNLYPHIFPVQPDELTGFSEGGHAFPATDIFAPPGTKFVAVTNGTVDEVSRTDRWDPAKPEKSTEGGLSVRILGDDGVRYYGAHLSAIADGILPGVWVAAGQLLGLVGNSGDARGTPTHLHFEISDPFSPSSLVDPFSYLVAWRDGINLTPQLETP